MIFLDTQTDKHCIIIYISSGHTPKIPTEQIPIGIRSVGIPCAHHDDDDRDDEKGRLILGGAL